MKKQFLSKSVPRGTRTIWRYLGALFLLFTFAIGNVWGTATNFHTFVAAGDTIIDVEGTGSTPSAKFTAVNNTNWAAVSTSAKNNSIYRMDPSTEEVATSKTNVYGTKLGSSAKSTYKVTGVSNVIFYVGTGTANRIAKLDVTENGKSKVSEAASVTLSDKNNAYKMTYALDASKSYTLEAYADNDIFCYAVKFTVGGGATPVCPSGLSISGTKDYTEGEKIELTAALTAGNGDITYQWYKGSTAEANKLTGKTAAKLEIASCAGSDAGDYYCVASKADCSDAVNEEAYTVTVATIQPTGTATISYALSGSTTTGTVTGVNSISGLSSSLTLSTLTLSGTKDGYSGAIKGCTSTTELVEADYVDVQFTVGSGYVFTPSAVTVQVNPFTATGAVKAVVKVMDAQPLVVASEVLSCAKSTDNAVTFASGAFTNKKFEGTVHLRMYFYGPASDKTFYLKSPISITGTVAVAPTKYNVTFDKNDEGASGSQTTLKYEAGAEVTLPACTFDAPTGKEFDAWTSTDVTITDGKFTMPSNAVTIKATWKTSSTKYTVTYKEGETTLDTEDVVAGTAPTGYSALESKSLASFVAWYNNADLAEEHKIADMSAETVSEATTYYGKWTYNYASSANIEQWVLDNSTKYDAVAQLGTLKYASNITNSLDSLNDDPSKDNRNYAYLGLKIKASGKMLDFRLANGQTVKVKLGATGNYPQVALNGGDYAAMSLTDNVWTYTADGADAYISIKTANNNTVVIKQIMIGEPIAEVILPAIVTLDANGGTYADESVKYTGTALVIGDATPADEDQVFAGWFDGEDQIDASAYVPTKNVTLVAHYANKPYTVTYVGGEGATGSMAPVDVAWGEDYTALACGFEKENHSFVSWAVTGVTGITEIAAGSAFVMPKGNVTLTAQWVNEALVARIGDNYYESLPAAVAAATDGDVVYLLKNVAAGPGVMIESANAKNITIDFGDHTYIVSTPAVGSTNTKTQGFHFEQGCTITMQNGTIGSTGDEVKMLVQNYCDLTLINITLDGTDLAGTGRYTLSNNCGNVVIGNGAEIVAQAGGVAFDVCYYASYPSVSVTVLPGASIDGKIEMSMSNGKAGVEENCQLIITGGEFENFSISHTNIPEAKVNAAISAGTFDAPVENLYCAEGFVPTPEDPVTHKYTVEPKEGVEIIGVVTTGGTNKTVSGLYKGDAAVNLDSDKKIGSGKYIYVTLKEGYTFEETDVLVVDLAAKSNLDGGTKALEITTGVGNIDGAVWKSIAYDDYTAGENTISLEGIAAGQTSIGLKRSANQNAWVNGLKVYRPMKPMLTAITIDGRDGVIDEANKTVAVTIPYEADLAALTVVPTIVWNEAAASNSIVVNDGAAWAEGANTYKLTDKDGDYTVYTITLTRDVLKHAVKFYDGETLLETVEVEDATSIAAGDVPADPTKDDYIFQGWAETAGGDVVDVTSFTISAAKNFYAKWAADGAIKLINKTSGAVNEDGYFITGVTATEANSEKAAAWGGTQGATISGTNQLNKVVQYNATTNQTKLQIKVYNTNNSDKYVYIHKIIEGNTAEESVETLTATSKTVVTSEFYEFNDTKNRSFYLTTNSADVKILQVKVIDDGATPMKQAGEAGYSLNLNKGRVVYYGNSDVTFEGLALNSASNYSVISSSEFQTTKNFSFSISSPVLLKVTTNSAKYYVSQNPNEDGTTATAITAAGTAEFELTETTNPWYLVPSTTSNVKYTNIAFELPKAATPVIETQPATNHTFDPGDMTATVVATVTEGTLHYQWYKKATVGDDEEVGTDAATLTTTTEGTYYVVVTNTLAGHQDVSVTSEEAELGYRVTNDATLMALSYGTPATAIALEDGVYTYNVELAKGTTDVPALAATATMDGYANVAINNAAEFVNYEASSTVTVKSEDETETLVYTVNFYVKHDLPQVDVTGTTTWDMTNVSENAINLSSLEPSQQNVRLLLANIDGVNNNASFNSQALMFEGQHIGRTGAGIKHLAGRYVQFNVTVPGAVFVTFESNGNNARTISINGKMCSRTTAGTDADDYITYALAVEPGSVEIIGYEGESANQYVRVSKIEFKAEYSHNRPGLNPANIGTLCWTNNAILGGATLYELAGKNENNKLVFDEVAENRLEAGKPYIFVPENGNTEIKLYNTDTEAALTSPIQNESGMQGTFVDLSSANGDLWGYYVISKNHYIYVDSDNVTLKKYRAYVLGLDDLNIVSNGPVPINGAPRRRIVMGAQGEQVATGIDNLEASEKPLKLMIDGQMYILRGEKLFDATGRLVK